MRTPSEALADILARIEPLGEVEDIPLVHSSGRVLAVEVRSDVDLPPFRKAMMDGFAVRSADLGGPVNAAGEVELACVGESKAGGAFDGVVPGGCCVEIYTGAPVPAECDQVVMIEASRRSANRVALKAAPRAGQHVAQVGEVLAKNAAVFAPGRRLAPVDLGVLAAVGCHPVRVFRRVRVAVLTTGDELVPPWETPGPDQIREGNTLVLASRCLELEAEPVRVGLVPDDEALLEREFQGALEEADVLLTTGGVSMGRYDLVGAVLEKLGVQPVLHKVAVKPGKPIWFGMAGRKPVLGLPGNPVSALLGMELFVRPVLAKLGGVLGPETEETLLTGRWSGPAAEPGDRQQNLPCRLERDPTGPPRLLPLPWKGSADIVNVAEAQAFAVLPAGQSLSPGDLVPYRPLRR